MYMQGCHNITKLPTKPHKLPLIIVQSKYEQKYIILQLSILI